MERVWAVVINTFREALRDKVLYGVLTFASGILLFTLALAELSLNEQRRVVLDIGLASISLFSVVIGIFLGSSLLYKEIERKTLYVILPKPIRRWEFLLGKYLGVVLTAAVFVAIMGGIQLWVTAIQAEASLALVVVTPVVALAVLGGMLWKASDRTAVILPWSLGWLIATAAVVGTTDVEVPAILAALVLNVGEVVLLSAVAMLFSSFSTPFLTGVLSFGVWLVGRSADEMAEMQSSVITESVREMLHVLAKVLPNFNLFAPGWNVLASDGALAAQALSYVGTTMAYGAAYAGVMLLAAMAIFQRRDFL